MEHVNNDSDTISRLYLVINPVNRNSPNPGLIFQQINKEKHLTSRNISKKPLFSALFRQIFQISYCYL